MSEAILGADEMEHHHDHDHGHDPHHGHGHHHPDGQRHLCCDHHDQTETGLKIRLSFVIAGLLCLILSGLLRWLRPGQNDLAVFWGMVGAVISAIPILRDAINGLRAKSENTEFYMNQFITLAVLACFVTGQYITAGLVAIILLVGHILEDRSLLGTNEAINSLLKLSRVRARRIKDGREEEVDAESLAERDVVRVLPGDTMPADGRVLSGFSTVNQASITGESLPVEACAGTAVFAGTSNLTGSIEVEVTRTGERTVLGRVREIVEEAQGSRAPIVRLTEEYARYYMPLILLAAGFVLFFTRDIQRAISVIVVSIPCTFVLAGPSAMVAALAAASRMGILVKSVRFFEVANGLDTVVFDKTGTLTTGELKVAGVQPRNGMQENEVLAWAAALESHSTHPIARAVARAAEERGLALPAAAEVQEKHGHGLSATISGHSVLVGRAAWLREHSVALDAGENAFSDLSALHMAVDGALAGIIYLTDTIRPESKTIGSALGELGIDRCIMLTGDRRGVAESIAQGIGFTEFEAECLPEQKLAAVQALKGAGRKVMVVGDGVNDAPALAAGDLSVAMGALGSDVAIQTADIALMAGDLSRLPRFLALSDKTLRIINQNMLCGFAFIAIAVALSSLGFITPIFAAFLHEFGAFFVIFNSARLLKFEA